MKKEILLLLAVLVLPAYADYRYITPDCDMDDWWNVAKVQDSNDGASSHDLHEAALANDSEYLYLYFRLDDSQYNNGSTYVNDYWGDDASDKEFVILYIDADRNASTGTVVSASGSGASYNMGVEYSLVMARQENTGTRINALYSGDFLNGGLEITNLDTEKLFGIAPTGKNLKPEFGEARILLSTLGLAVDSEINWTICITRDGDTAYAPLDWFDGSVPQSYKIAAKPTSVSGSHFGKALINSNNEDRLGEFLDNFPSGAMFVDDRGDSGLALDLLEMSVMNDETYLYFHVRMDNKLKTTTISNQPLSTDANYVYEFRHTFLGDAGLVEAHGYDLLVDIDNNPETGFLVGPEGNQIGVDITLDLFRRGNASSGYALYTGVKTCSTGIADNSPVSVSGWPTTALSYGLRNRGVGVYPHQHDDIDEWEMPFPLSLSSGNLTYSLTPGSTIKFVALASQGARPHPQSDWMGPFTYTVADKPATAVLGTYGKPVMDASFNDWDQIPGVADGRVDGHERHDLVSFKVCNDETNLYLNVMVDEAPMFVPFKFKPWLSTTPWNPLSGNDQFGYYTSADTDLITVYMDADNNPSTGQNITASTTATTNYVPSTYTFNLSHSVRAYRRTTPDGSGGSYGWILYEGLYGVQPYYQAYFDPTNAGLANRSILFGVNGLEMRIPFSEILRNPDDEYSETVNIGDTIPMTVCFAVVADTIRIDWLDFPIEYHITGLEPACGDWGYPSGDMNKDCYVDFQDLFEFTDRWLDTSFVQQ